MIEGLRGRWVEREGPEREKRACQSLLASILGSKMKELE